MNIGLVISLSLCLIAFEWKTYENLSTVDKSISNMLPEAGIDIEVVPVQPPPPPVMPEPKQPEVTKDLTEDLSKINVTQLTEDVLPSPTVDVPAIIPSPVPAGPAANIPEEVVVDPPMNIWELEKQPEGQEAFYKYISKNLRYPNAARKENIEGKVYVQFIVNTDGSLTDIAVTKGIGFGCDEEAIRVIQNAPKWTPGRQRGKPVRVRMSVPIIFKLNK